MYIKFIQVAEIQNHSKTFRSRVSSDLLLEWFIYSEWNIQQYHLHQSNP